MDILFFKIFKWVKVEEKYKVKRKKKKNKNILNDFFLKIVYKEVFIWYLLLRFFFF